MFIKSTLFGQLNVKLNQDRERERERYKEKEKFKIVPKKRKFLIKFY